MGLVVVMMLVTDLALSLIEPERAGTASAVLETGSELGGALGIALLGSIGAAVFTHQMAPALPAQLSPQAQEAAGQTLGGALAVAGSLPSDAGGALIAAARDAFTAGMSVASWAGACLMLAAAVLCVRALRSPRSLQPGVRSRGEQNVT